MLCLWCVTGLSTIFQQYRGGQFYWWRKPDFVIQIYVVLSDRLLILLLSAKCFVEHVDNPIATHQIYLYCLWKVFDNVLILAMIKKSLKISKE